MMIIIVFYKNKFAVSIGIFYSNCKIGHTNNMYIVVVVIIIIIIIIIVFNKASLQNLIFFILLQIYSIVIM